MNTKWKDWRKFKPRGVLRRND